MAAEKKLRQCVKGLILQLLCKALSGKAACRTRKMAVEDPDEPDCIAMEPFMPVSWGADHRVLDGATLARCAVAFKTLLEHPERLLLDLR